MATRTNSISSYSDFRMSRRTFTKLAALGTAAAISGIGEVGAYPTKFVDKLIEPASAVSRTESGSCEVYMRTLFSRLWILWKGRGRRVYGYGALGDSSDKCRRDVFQGRFY